jgi:hypothetical protein
MRNSTVIGELLRSPRLRDEIARERATRSLRAFVRQAWHVVEPSTPFVPGFHIDAICDHLEAITRGQLRNLIINVPPRHMKSLLVCVFWPAWDWILHPERRWLYSSYGAPLSTRDSLKCRRLIESPWYRDRWGHIVSLTGDQNAKMRYDNTRPGYRLSTSVGGPVTGEGGDRIVCDDPHKVDEADSDTSRKAVLDWWDVAMSTRVNDPKASAMVVVMQRCHQRDLSGHLLEKGNFDHLCLLPSTKARDARRRSDSAIREPNLGNCCGRNGTAQKKSRRRNSISAATPLPDSFSSGRRPPAEAFSNGIGSGTGSRGG